MKKNKILILLVIGLSLGSCVQTDDEAFSPEHGGRKRRRKIHYGHLCCYCYNTHVS